MVMIKTAREGLVKWHLTKINILMIGNAKTVRKFVLNSPKESGNW